jgi:sterol desaturase/sphingolipid hydroxylase (fatty acid hydroxylase superfamily)
MIFLLKLIITFFFVSASTTLLGYWVHWAFHQPWTLWFHRAHMNHHQVQYPATDFFSEKYRSAGKDSSAILFGIVFSPVVLAIVGVMLLGLVSLSTGIVVLSSLSLCGFAHDYFHDQFHIKSTWLKRFQFFLNWRRLHYVHHLDMKLNFGIVHFYWDKLFKTFDDADDIKLES